MHAPSVVRFGFLRRLPSLDHDGFARHWRMIHGPLVAGLDGFTAFTERYVQNHLVAGEDSTWIDGVSMTHQRTREDYTSGFFDHPDVAHAQNDEQRFLDAANSQFFIGPRTHIMQSPTAVHKVIALADVDTADEAIPGAVQLSVTRPVSSGEQLRVVIEAWFDDEANAAGAVQAALCLPEIHGAVRVHEVQQYPKENACLT